MMPLQPTLPAASGAPATPSIPSPLPVNPAPTPSAGGTVPPNEEPSHSIEAGVPETGETGDSGEELTDEGPPVEAADDAGIPGDGTVAQLPDPGPEGDGDYQAGPTYSTQPELTAQGNPRGQSFQFTMPLADSAIFDGTDSTLDPNKPVNQNRRISVYVPAAYQDGTPAPVLVIQDGDGPLGLVSTALDNLAASDDPARRLPAFVAVAVQNGGNDAQGSERGLEYDTMSDRYARFIDQEVLPAVASNPELLAAYPNFSFTDDPSGRATLGCSSGGAAAFTMAWFRPDLFSRVIAYSTTLVNQQDFDAPEREMYPNGAWDYHSELELIANSEVKSIRVFLNVNENDLRANDPESTQHNWVMANERTASALGAKGYHYRYVYGLGAGHCDGGVQRATLADALVWAWRGYQPEAN